jgi:2'-5' RNA ligase
MSTPQLTREFSLCLLPTDEVTADVSALRAQLPPSPYRDDVPHITLIRGISAAANMSDETLITDVGATLSLSDRLPLRGTVQRIANKSNQFYRETGGIILESSAELLAFRKDAADRLMARGYIVEAQELNTYTPHITIRLGVPLQGELLDQANTLFHGRTISFGSWVLFRLVMQGDKRLMHVVRP